MREAEVQPSAFTFLVEPVFPVRVVQVMRFVLEVIAHVAHDHAAGAAAGPTPEAQAALFQVHDLHPSGIGLAHDPAELGPDQRVLEVAFGLVPDVFGVDAEVDLLAGRVLDGVPEGFAWVVPDPPFALHVVGVGAFPVGGARSGMRRKSPSLRTSHTPRGAKFKSAHQTFSGSGTSRFVAPFFQPVMRSEPQRTAGPWPQPGSRVRRIGAPGLPGSRTLNSPR